MIDYEMPELEYHARPELSSTGARLLLECPSRFRYQQTHPQQGKRTFDVGTAAHSKVLGIGAGVVEYPAEHLTASGNVSEKAATVLWAEEQRRAGLTPVTAADLRAVDGMAEAVLAHPSARSLLELDGHREVSVFSTVEDVDTRARLDVLTDETWQGRFGVDLKTTDKPADKGTFTRTAVDYGYHVQAAWYETALLAQEVELTAFLFIVVEKKAPHLVAVHQLDTQYRQMGAVASREARRRHRDYITNGHGCPCHPDDIQLVAPPVWAAIQHEEKYGE